MGQFFVIGSVGEIAMGSSEESGEVRGVFKDLRRVLKGISTSTNAELVSILGR